MADYSRRSFMKSVALGSAGVALAGYSKGGAQEADKKTAASEAASGESFRFVHLTDMHVRSKRKGNEGWLACAKQIRESVPKIDFAMIGGDMAFDGNYTPKEEFERAIGFYKAGQDALGIPAYQCLGNHDCFGYGARRKCPVDDPDIGKKFIMDRVGMPSPYYSFDHKGWHFVCLDTMYDIVVESGPTYEARIGEKQLDWLAKDLGKNHGKPTVAMMHIAAFCNIGQWNGDKDAKAMNPSMVVKDNKELRLILERHGVKALLQGHSHKTEDYFFHGVWYLTSPAVSGAWWSGNWNNCEHGYTEFTCEGDKLSWERRTFPWEVYLEPDDNTEREKLYEYNKFREEQKALADLENAT